MKKIIWRYGLIAGLISVIGFFIAVVFPDKVDFSNGMIYGYASMLLAFSLLFVAIKNYRDKYNNGAITFGKAFLLALYITLIASTIYVGIWLVYYYFFMPDFFDKYAQYYQQQLQTQGLTQAAIQVKMEDMKQTMEMVKNPVMNALYTYTEILPLGLILSLISAGILWRRPKPAI